MADMIVHRALEKLAAKKKHAFRNLSNSATWLACAEWAWHKRNGTPEPEKDTTAADRGSMLHDRLEALVKSGHRGRVDARGLDEHDAEMLESALAMTWDLFDRFPGVAIGTEVGVTLTYEPESKGHVDLMGYDRASKTLIVADAKFGQGVVTIESTQVRGYGAMALEALRSKGHEVVEVLLAVIQPELSDTPIETTLNAAELDRFRGYLEETVKRQDDGSERRPAASLDVCQWCPFKLHCEPHKRMLSQALDDAEEVSKLTAFPETINRFYMGKGTIEEAFKVARQAILEDEASFPGWRRTKRKAARAWELDKFEESEIIASLNVAGKTDFMRLKTPTQVGVDDSIEFCLKPLAYIDVLTKEKK